MEIISYFQDLNFKQQAFDCCTYEPFLAKLLELSDLCEFFLEAQA